MDSEIREMSPKDWNEVRDIYIGCCRRLKATL